MDRRKQMLRSVGSLQNPCAWQVGTLLGQGRFGRTSCEGIREECLLSAFTRCLQGKGTEAFTSGIREGTATHNLALEWRLLSLKLVRQCWFLLRLTRYCVLHSLLRTLLFAKEGSQPYASWLAEPGQTAERNGFADAVILSSLSSCTWTSVLIISFQMSVDISSRLYMLSWRCCPSRVGAQVE